MFWLKYSPLTGSLLFCGSLQLAPLRGRQAPATRRLARICRHLSGGTPQRHLVSTLERPQVNKLHIHSHDLSCVNELDLFLRGQIYKTFAPQAKLCLGFQDRGFRKCHLDERNGRTAANTKSCLQNVEKFSGHSKERHLANRNEFETSLMPSWEYI